MVYILNISISFSCGQPWKKEMRRRNSFTSGWNNYKNKENKKGEKEKRERWE